MLKIITSPLFFPLLFIRQLLNFLFQGSSNDWKHTKEDVDRHPVLYALFGWFSIYLVLVLLSPISLFFYSFCLTGSEFVSANIVFGCMLWVIILFVLLMEARSIVKSLTRRFKKSGVALRLNQNF